MQKQSCLRDFDIINKLGEGAFGQVFKVKRKLDGKQYAMKKVKIGSMKAKERDNALNEIRILASYSDDFIIGYKEAFYDENSGTLCIVMEFASGGDVLKKNQNHLKNKSRYKEQQIWAALVHMTQGLKSLHDKKILHRDLKCANVFVTGDSIYKLGDLNVSKVLKKDMAQTQIGTPYYASPQVWKDRPYDAKSDIWSLGCVLYEMAALKPPFTARDLQGLYKKVCTGIFERIPMIYSNDLASTIAMFLKVDPSKRPTTQQILSNLIVQRRFNGQIINNMEEQENDPLLKTIKYNPKDLRGLKNILPKANYQICEESEKKERINIDEMRGYGSCKNSRKGSSAEDGHQKLQQFLQKRKMVQEKQRQRQIKILQEQKDELTKKRERVMSACGVRKEHSYDSPRIVIHNKREITQNKNKSSKREEERNLPPQIPRPGNQQINFKLPPRPGTRHVSRGGISYQDKDKLRSARQQSSQKVKPLDGRKQNVQKGSQNSIPVRGIVRSSSAQKILYPSWWG